MKNNLIGKKQFTEKNQKDFASISCDYNPIHVDPLMARRLITGQRIVHGVNILLTGLNFLFKKCFKLCGFFGLHFSGENKTELFSA